VRRLLREFAIGAALIAVVVVVGVAVVVAMGAFWPLQAP